MAGKACDRWSLRVATPVRVACYVLAPMRAVCESCAKFLSYLLRFPIEPQRRVSPKRIRELIEEGSFEAMTEEAERRLICSIFEFRETEVWEVMVPRVRMVACDASRTVSEAEEIGRWV